MPAADASLFIFLGSRGYRTSLSAFALPRGSAVPRCSGAVPLSFVAGFTYALASGVGPFSAPCEREPESDTHCAHKVVFVIGARGHKHELRGRERGVFSRRERSPIMARGGADAPPINATHRCYVTFRAISYVYPPRNAPPFDNPCVV
jgi:hypothetical protein